MQIFSLFKPTKSKAWLLIFALAQIITFTAAFIHTSTHPFYTLFKSTTGVGFPLAKASAASVMLSTALILFPICRNIITRVRRTFLVSFIPFEGVVGFHRVIGMSLSSFSFIHVCAHFNNLRLTTAESGVDPAVAIWSNPTNLSGLVLVVVLMLITTSSKQHIKRTNYEIFFYTHHLYSTFLGLLLLHGSFCYIKQDSGQCEGPQFWKYLIPSLLTYILERILKESSFLHHTQIQKIISHPFRVVEIHIKKDRFKMLPGQHILINVPELSLGEWHAFTLTSAPEEDYLSVHIRCCGDWTNALASRVGCRWGNDGEVLASSILIGDDALTFLPRIIIEGPFGASYEDVFNYTSIVLIGAGIGVTPFASLLKHIWYRLKHPSRKDSTQKLRKIYFYWICRDKQSFEWFQSLLVMIENDARFFGLLEIRIYLTGAVSDSDRSNIVMNAQNGRGAARNQKSRSIRDPITKLRSKTSYGRPDFNKIFSDIYSKHQNETIRVYFCGPKAMDSAIRIACAAHSSPTTRFHLHKENF